jgi:hypothetical protein
MLRVKTLGIHFITQFGTLVNDIGKVSGICADVWIGVLLQ